MVLTVDRCSAICDRKSERERDRMRFECMKKGNTCSNIYLPIYLALNEGAIKQQFLARKNFSKFFKKVNFLIGKQTALSERSGVVRLCIHL